MNPQGKETRFISTSLYVPTELCFDKDDNLWALGWPRDSLTKEGEEKRDYQLVRKFSAAGVEIGSDGEELVYRVGHGNTRLIWPRPGVK